MKRALKTSVVLIALLLIATGCRSSGDLSRAETQRSFGVRMAKMSLWREAMFRFQRAVEIEPQNAMARNNLAVALEATGDLEGAAREYREALRLDRSNQHIQRNYSRFVEFTQRSKRREAQSPSAAMAAAAEPESQPAIAGTPAPEEPSAAQPTPGGAKPAEPERDEPEEGLDAPAEPAEENEPTPEPAAEEATPPSQLVSSTGGIQ